MARSQALVHPLLASGSGTQNTENTMAENPNEVTANANENEAENRATGGNAAIVQRHIQFISLEDDPALTKGPDTDEKSLSGLVESLRGTVGTHAKEIKVLKARAEYASKPISALAGQMRVYARRNDEDMKQLKETVHKHEIALSKEHSEQTQALLKRVASPMNAEVEEMKREAKRQRTELDNLRKDLGAFKAGVEAKNAVNAEMQSKVARLKRTVSCQKSTVDALRGKEERQDAEILALRAEDALKDAYIKELQQKILELQGSVSEVAQVSKVEG